MEGSGQLHAAAVSLTGGGDCTNSVSERLVTAPGLSAGEKISCSYLDSTPEPSSRVNGPKFQSEKTTEACVLLQTFW